MELKSKAEMDCLKYSLAMEESRNVSRYVGIIPHEALNTSKYVGFMLGWGECYSRMLKQMVSLMDELNSVKSLMIKNNQTKDSRIVELEKKVKALETEVELSSRAKRPVA